MTKQTEKKKRSKLKTILVISTSSFLFIIAVCLILVFAILTDKTTSTHQKSDNESAEIINKNYVKGFKNTGNSGIFSFSMDEKTSMICSRKLIKISKINTSQKSTLKA